MYDTVYWDFYFFLFILYFVYFFMCYLWQKVNGLVLKCHAVLLQHHRNTLIDSQSVLFLFILQCS